MHVSTASSFADPLASNAAGHVDQLGDDGRPARAPVQGPVRGPGGPDQSRRDLRTANESLTLVERTRAVEPGVPPSFGRCHTTRGEVAATPISAVPIACIATIKSLAG